MYSIIEQEDNALFIGVIGEFYDKYDIRMMFDNRTTLTVGVNGKVDIGEESILKLGLSYSVQYQEITMESYQVRLTYLF